MKKATCPNCKTKLTTSSVDPFGRLFCPTCKYLGEVTLTPDPKTNRPTPTPTPTPTPDREQELTEIADRVAAARIASERNRDDRDALKGDSAMDSVWKAMACDCDHPDASEKGFLKTCCAPFLNDADMARLPKTADELIHFRMAFNDATTYERRLLEPDAKRGRKQQANQKTISPLGGFAAAPNKDDDIFRVLREYKRAHPWHKMTAACEKTVDAGSLAYSNREKLIKRLSDIGKRMTPAKSPSEIYASL
jgi:uncharacterized Zn finger protein (UPF0148 family)